jgi:hypothetical protein
MKPGRVLRHEQERMLAAIRKCVVLPFSPSFPNFQMLHHGRINVITALTTRADPVCVACVFPRILPRPEVLAALPGNTFLRRIVRYCFGFDDWKKRCSRWPLTCPLRFPVQAIPFQNPEARDRKHDDAPFRRVRCSASGHKNRFRSNARGCIHISFRVVGLLCCQPGLTRACPNAHHGARGCSLHRIGRCLKVLVIISGMWFWNLFKFRAWVLL